MMIHDLLAVIPMSGGMKSMTWSSSKRFTGCVFSSEENPAIWSIYRNCYNFNRLMQ